MSDRMRFGIFLSPFHAPGQNPTVALERDLELLQHLDRHGYDEAWIGEHHSGGFELVPSPEVFIAVAAERTRHIRLGTGVSSVPYHHPLLLADRMVLLDHLTRGRVIFGTGPGALITDVHMMGLDVNELRHHHEAGLEAIIRLLLGETVTQRTDLFTLNEARLQMLPYSDPHFEIAVTSVRSPAGPRLAGRFGLGVLSVAATDADAFDFLKDTWGLVEERAAECGQVVNRNQWRLVAPMHLAPTEKEAREDVHFGLADMMRFGSIGPFAKPGGPDTDEILATIGIDGVVDGMNQGFAAVGTPDRAVDMIKRLQAQSGGFGTLLMVGHEWADREATLRSYELFARYVMPEFQGSAIAPVASWNRLWTQRKNVLEEAQAARDKARAEHQADREAKRASATAGSTN